MTVSSSVNVAGPFACTGAIVTFPFTFPYFNTADLKVYLVDPALETETLLTYGTNYNVTPASVGGTITTVATYPTGKQILIKRTLIATQEIDLANQGDWLPEVHEEAFDRAIMLIQQILETLGRAIITDESGFNYDAKNNRIINLASGTASTDAVNLGQMQTADTNIYTAAVSAAFAAMVSWVTTYVTNYLPAVSVITNPHMIVPSSQNIVAGQTRIYLPVPVHGIVLSYGGVVQAQTRDYTYTAGNNYVDLTFTPLTDNVVTAFIYTSSTAATAFENDYVEVLAGATSATLPGGAFTNAMVCFNGIVQRPVVDYTHAAGTAVVNFTVPAVSDTIVTVIKF